MSMIICCIRNFGAYPDGIRFAVLLGPNCVTPLLDRLYRHQVETAETE